MMGGTLTVTSELGFGSTFTFYGKFFCKSLPTNSETAAATASFIQSIDLEKVPKLLVVEDHRINQKVCEAILKKLGCEFTFADNGQEAIDHLGKETFDLVLMDCQMPVMDGYEATKHIRACGKPFSNIPIIALTANALSGDRDRCIEVGMDDFLSKPFNLHGLRTIIAKWFRGKP
jgi:CheY-like chemotaxis protein